MRWFVFLTGSSERGPLLDRRERRAPIEKFRFLEPASLPLFLLLLRRVIAHGGLSLELGVGVDDRHDDGRTPKCQCVCVSGSVAVGSERDE